MARAKASSKAAGTRQGPSPVAGSAASTSPASAERGSTAEKTSLDKSGTDASFLGPRVADTLPRRERATDPFRPELFHPRAMTSGAMRQTLLANGVHIVYGQTIPDKDMVRMLRELGFDVGTPPKTPQARRKKAHADQGTFDDIADDGPEPGDR